MSRLESADATLSAATASKADFEKRLANLLHDAEIVAMIGEVIQQSDYEYHDDDTYRGHASAMRDAALKLREAVKKKDYDAARAAFTEAWDGTAPVDMGVGGSIPFIAEFLEAFPEASVLVTGVEDTDTRAHGANEGLHLAEFERVVLAETLLLAKLGSA